MARALPAVHDDKIALGAAAVFETASFISTLRQFLEANRSNPFWRSIELDHPSLRPAS